MRKFNLNTWGQVEEEREEICEADTEERHGSN